MKLYTLAWSNFKRSVREFGVLVLSLAFSVFIFFNFQNIVFSDAMDVLENYNKDYIDIVTETLSVVFVVFLFFFIWYASNVFLNQRKKEIGIYIFMGLDNRRIGKLYLLESGMVGLFALAFGLVAGLAFSKLFQMILLRLSRISADVRFSFSLQSVMITSAMFLTIHGLMTLKGCHTLRTSSVLNLLSGAKQKEMKPEHRAVTTLRILAGTGILAAGYVAAWRTGDLDSLELGLAATILVIVGVYLLYSGLIPAVLRALTRSKGYLYKKQRTLWVNSLAFRIKKNYRTYAMVTVLMISAVTVLAVSIAMQQRYERMVWFDQTYTYQIISSHEWDGEEICEGIEEDNEVSYWNSFRLLLMDASVFDSRFQNMSGVVSYSQVKEAAGRAGLDFTWPEPGAYEAIDVSHEIMMSFVDEDRAGEKITIDGETYELLGSTKTPYLGNLQTYMNLAIVSDAAFERLHALAENGRAVENWVYNYRIAVPENVDASRPYLTGLAERSEDGSVYTGVNFTDPLNRDTSWVCVMYSLCLFLFATFVLAGGSIMFLKTGNDVYEDHERYQVLCRLGIPRRILGKSVRSEICFTYCCPFVLTVLTSWFSVRALGNVMKEDLFQVNLWSAGAILVLFTLVCAFSVRMARRKLLG